MKCEICKKPITDFQPRMIFRETSWKAMVHFHNCCYQENLLFEVWNALSLGIKYESHCQHVDYAARFDPATFTPEQVAKAIQKQLDLTKDQSVDINAKWGKAGPANLITVKEKE